MIRKLWEKHRQVLLYIVFGGITTGVGVGSFILLDSVLGIDPLVVNVISWLLAVGTAYGTNRRWVFCSQTRGAALWKEVMGFYAGRVATLLLEEGLLLVFVTWLRQNSTAVKLIAQLVVLVGNYLLSKWLIFNRKENKTTE